MRLLPFVLSLGCMLGACGAAPLRTERIAQTDDGERVVVSSRFVPASQYAAVFAAELARAHGDADMACAQYEEALAAAEGDAWLAQRLASCREAGASSAATPTTPPSTPPSTPGPAPVGDDRERAELCVEERYLFGDCRWP